MCKVEQLTLRTLVANHHHLSIQLSFECMTLRALRVHPTQFAFLSPSTCSHQPQWSVVTSSR